MRDVRQLPASKNSVVDAPRAVSSDASPNPATVRRQARLDTGGAGGGGEPALNLQRGQPDHPIRRRADGRS